MKHTAMKFNQQTVGNIGLFYACYQLSRFGWNVMPTARNARGVDILIYSQDASRKLSIQVKTLSRRVPVPFGSKLDHLFADYVVICRRVAEEVPECFILTPEEIRRLIHRGDKDGKVSYWLQPREYESEEFREKWERIGWGLETTQNAVSSRLTRPLRPPESVPGEYPYGGSTGKVIIFSHVQARQDEGADCVSQVLARRNGRY